MNIWINGKHMRVKEGSRLKDVASEYDVFVRNGYGISKEDILHEGDRVVATKKGVLPSNEDLYDLILSRNGEDVTSKLSKACVCVCGLGGLGSNVVAMLSRLGVGKLILVDFDVVDPTNLNRQNYFIEDIGSLKTLATANIVKNINPYINVIVKNIKLDSTNILDVIADADVVVEAVDNPSCKAEIVNAVLLETNKYCVASSGMAGFNSSNCIKTTNPMGRLYVAGDNLSEACEGNSLMSPLVSVCAGHQANMVLRLLLGLVDV